jgi:hypothetical protein
MLLTPLRGLENHPLPGRLKLPILARADFAD